MGFEAGGAAVGILHLAGIGVYELEPDLVLGEHPVAYAAYYPVSGRSCELLSGSSRMCKMDMTHRHRVCQFCREVFQDDEGAVVG